MTEPSMPTTSLGYFADQHGESSEMGRAQTRAARAYGVPCAAFAVHGSTGANAVALGAYKLLHGGLNALVARGAHHSIINRTLEIGGSLRFARSEVDRRYEASLPPSPSQIEEALVTGPPVDLVVVTTPVYEGLHARVTEIAEIVHDRGALLHVDSAWGPLAGFHPRLPRTPVALGADSASISVHKLGGALSQCALLTWSGEERLDLAIRAAQLQYCTTSPSYILAASLDEAIIMLANHGQAAIEKAATLRERLKSQLKDALPSLEVLEEGTSIINDLNTIVDQSAPMDPTRLTIGLAAYAITGFELSERLMSKGIIPEKAGVQTLTVFIHIGAKEDLVERVSGALIETLTEAGLRRDLDRAPLLPNPLLGLDNEPEIDPSAAMTRALVDGIAVPLAQAAGLICLELVEAYPPGIPIGVPGFRLSEQAVSYLAAVDKAGGRVVTLERHELNGPMVRVLPETER